jgi:transcriptional regulator with PAS, ATPase and Fis domain
MTSVLPVGGCRADATPRAIDMIGESEPMLRIYEQIRRAAGSDSSIVVCGESGTGKELVASALHALSPRADGPFIDVNTAAIPPNLIESELFGLTKGAFTGASVDRIGCFDAAH